MIIAVGFKINNERAVGCPILQMGQYDCQKFAIERWVMGGKRLKNGGPFLTEEYFEKQLEKICEI